jgi:hypothetical protein
MWQAFRFVAPFSRAGEYGALAASAWEVLFQFSAFVVLAGILGNIAAYLITDQELARPEWSMREDATNGTNGNGSLDPRGNGSSC